MFGFLFLGPLFAEATLIPLAWKWRLGVGRCAVIVGLLALLIGGVLGAVSEQLPASRLVQGSLVWLLTSISALAIVLYRFYRDPERISPARADVVVSPADGEIAYVRTTEAGTLPVACKHGRDHTLRELTKTRLENEEATIIGIAMNFLDVHVNRAPISGAVRLQRHFPGRFGSLKLPDMVFENERMTTIIENRGLQIAVVQIASRLVRQIVSFIREGENVALGQRIGMIRFGSQVDVVLPFRPNLKVLVEPGMRVRAGESLLAVVEAVPPDRDTSSVDMLAAKAVPAVANP